MFEHKQCLRLTRHEAHSWTPNPLETDGKEAAEWFQCSGDSGWRISFQHELPSRVLPLHMTMTKQVEICTDPEGVVLWSLYEKHSGLLSRLRRSLSIFLNQEEDIPTDDDYMIFVIHEFAIRMHTQGG